MRALMFVLPVMLLMALLAACSISAEDADDNGEADPTETPVMDSQQTDDSDDAISDDAEAVDDSADDSVSDDSVTDDATDDAVDDADDAVDDSATEEEDETPEPVEHTIEMVEGNEFSPAEITIAPGDTVTWVNLSDMVHTVSADPDIATDPSHVELPEGAETWHSGGIDPDDSFSITLDVPGTYIYFCYPHQDAGMLGTIIVEGPDPEADDPAVDEADDAERDPSDAEADDTDVDPDEMDDDSDDPAATATPAPTQPQYRGKDATN